MIKFRLGADGIRYTDDDERFASMAALSNFFSWKPENLRGFSPHYLKPSDSTHRKPGNGE
ncbi:MAG: hypothetical protein R3F19_05610 [Verrucomicrobiales bacterium]